MRSRSAKLLTRHFQTHYWRHWPGGLRFCFSRKTFPGPDNNGLSSIQVLALPLSPIQRRFPGCRSLLSGQFSSSWCSCLLALAPSSPLLRLSSPFSSTGSPTWEGRTEGGRRCLEHDLDCFLPGGAHLASASSCSAAAWAWWPTAASTSCSWWTTTRPPTPRSSSVASRSPWWPGSTGWTSSWRICGSCLASTLIPGFSGNGPGRFLHQ